MTNLFHILILLLTLGGLENSRLVGSDTALSHPLPGNSAEEEGRRVINAHHRPTPFIPLSSAPFPCPFSTLIFNLEIFLTIEFLGSLGL